MITGRVLAIVACCAIFCSAEQLFCAKLKSIKNWNNPEYTNLTVTGRTENAIIKYSFTFDIYRDLLKYFVRIEAYFQSSGRRQLFINKTMDLCAILNGKEIDLLAWTLLGVFRDYKTMPRKCPMRQGQYYARDMYMEETNYPLVLPQGTFTAKFYFMTTYSGVMQPTSNHEIVGFAKRKRRRKKCD